MIIDTTGTTAQTPATGKSLIVYAVVAIVAYVLYRRVMK